MTRAIVITTNDEVRRVELSTPPQLEELKALVGGYIEAVPILPSRDTMYLNEEGKLIGLPFNAIATGLTRGVVADSDLIMGDVVLLGPVDHDGNDTDVTLDIEGTNKA